MITVEARACRPIIPDPAGPSPAARCQPAPGGRAPAPARLPSVPDPRSALGRRHRLVAILALAAAAVLAGARSFAAIAEWATDAPQPVRAALGARRDAPDHWAVPAETTIRRTLGRLDANALAAAVGAWLADRQHHDRTTGDGAAHAQRPQPRQRAVAVDRRDAARRPRPRRRRPPGAPAGRDGPHQPRDPGPTRASAARPRRFPAFGRCWRPWSWPAWSSPPTRSTPTPTPPGFLVADKQAHYLFGVKANQPTLLAHCQRRPWHRVPVADRTRDQAHGRIEHRALKVVTVGHLGFPHAAQVLQVTRKHTVGVPHPSTRRRRWQTVTVHAITSLPFGLARPACLADLLRGHWAIEAVHHIRDVTFAEDGSQVRTGAGPHGMACLRNLVIGVLSRAGPVNLAAALRHHARDPARPLATLGITPGTNP
jgi:DDE_Tnp_1-associated